jgi:hypothetical protein
MLKEMQYRLGKKSKPILSDDDYEMLNQNIKTAITYEKEVEVQYYQNGYILSTYGKIKKLDFVNKTVILSTYEKISADDIVQLDII